MSDKKHYVYEHWRTDKNEPFYVGKGCGHRAYLFGKKYGRNLHHQAIAKKLSLLDLKIDVKIVARFDTAAEAFSYEMERIAHWLSLGMELVNRTAGGDGLRDPSIETRARISAWHKGRKPSEETRARMRASQAKRPRQTPEQIEKARVNRIAKGYKPGPDTKRKMSSAKKEMWEKIQADPVLLAEYKALRSETSKKMWEKMRLEEPERYREIKCRPRKTRKEPPTPEILAARRERAKLSARRLAKAKRLAEGPKTRKPYTKKKTGPHGNLGKKRTPEALAKLAAAAEKKKGTTLSEETVEKMRNAWTDERRAKQSQVAKGLWENGKTGLKGRKRTPEEIEIVRLKNIGRKDSEESKQKKRRSWTPERRAAQAERLAQRNRDRAMKNRISAAQQEIALSNDTLH